MKNQQVKIGIHIRVFDCFQNRTCQFKCDHCCVADGVSFNLYKSQKRERSPCLFVLVQNIVFNYETDQAFQGFLQLPIVITSYSTQPFYNAQRGNKLPLIGLAFQLVFCNIQQSVDGFTLLERGHCIVHCYQSTMLFDLYTPLVLTEQTHLFILCHLVI